MIAYLDMDGVLCDFIGKYKKIRPDVPDTKEKFFYAIKEHRVFATLNKLHDTDKLVRLLFDTLSTDVEVQILSSMGTYNKEYSKLVREQKEEWLDKNGIMCKRNFVHSFSEKKKYANRDSFLIDDRTECVDQFRDAGARAVLYIDNKWLDMKRQIINTVEELKDANLFV